MSSSNLNKHLTLDERRIIETGIRNGSSKVVIVQTLGKDKSTIGKEIKLHRICTNPSSLAMECANYKKCKLGRSCKPSCTQLIQFVCKRRDRSPGACNGCAISSKCHFNHFMYKPEDAYHDYRMNLTLSRQGINYSQEEIISIGHIIQPPLKQGLSPYSILQAHPEINMSERTMYTFIEAGVFKNAGIDIITLDLRGAAGRKSMKRRDRNVYKQRKDHKYLAGRQYKDYLRYIENNPEVSIVQMDTVYNDISNGPFSYKHLSLCDIPLPFSSCMEKRRRKLCMKGYLLLNLSLAENYLIEKQKSS